jgi:Asp-tRNA(Asn)/Glu-tRNA(Gln) amidotransferase A subunit family amidase
MVQGTILEVDCMELTSHGIYRYPIVTVPLGFDETIQEPVCLFMIGRPFSEGILVQLM